MPAFDIPPDGDWYLDINGASKHFGTNRELNERNSGAGVSYQWDKEKNIVNLIKLGQYLNSINKPSNYLGIGVKKRFGDKDGFHVDVGGLAGLVTGYESKPIPALLPLLTIGNGAFGLNVSAIPPVGDNIPATLMFSTEIPLK